MTGDPPVLVTAHGPVLQITLNRPEKRNAIIPEMSALIEAALDHLEDDPVLRVGVLAGNGTAAFCAGADLTYVARKQSASLATTRGGFAGFVCRSRSKPVVAAVQGYAVGGGFEVALACDLLVAERTARFGLPEVTRGVLAGSGMLRLASSIPRARAMEIILTGRLLPATDAAEWGLVSELTPPGCALSRAHDLAATIAANAPAAVRESLGLMNTLADPTRQDWELAAAASTRLRGTSDASEGAKAFLEHREASWTDQ